MDMLIVESEVIEWVETVQAFEFEDNWHLTHLIGRHNGQYPKENCNKKTEKYCKMESIARLSSIPIIESGVKTAESVYANLKKRNQFFTWGFETAESVVLATVESLKPAAKLMEGPINRIDNMMCKSLDIVENKIPSVYLPPQMIYWNTKEYMSDHLVQPVIKRANSMKQIGSVVLDNRVSNYAANHVENVINLADKYVDIYLPTEDQTDGAAQDIQISDTEMEAVKTFHKGQRLSRKLKRRLTERTFAEARALKKQSKEAIHVLLYAAELIVTDPKLALGKAKELWDYLSKDEPENQERPHTLEQLIILIARESTRRMVHLVNFTCRSVSHIPRSVFLSIRLLVHQFLHVTNSLLRIAHIDKNATRDAQEATTLLKKLQLLYNGMQHYTTNILERFVVYMATGLGNEKLLSETSSCNNVIRANNNPTRNNVNGAY